MPDISTKTGITRQQPFVWEGTASSYTDRNHGFSTKPSFIFIESNMNWNQVTAGYSFVISGNYLITSL